MERVASDESLADVADDVGVAASTLRELYNDRAELYLYGEADDDRVDTALEDVRPLNEPAAEPDEDLNERLERLEQKFDPANLGQSDKPYQNTWKDPYYDDLVSAIVDAV